MRKVELRMNEKRKYHVIKKIADNNCAKIELQKINYLKITNCSSDN